MRVSRPKIIIVILLVALVLVSLYLVSAKQQIPQQNTKVPATPAITAAYGDAPTKDACASKGGEWRQWGLAGKEFCQIPAQDANKSCNDGSQCSYGLCKGDGQSTQGSCAQYKEEFGCYSVIKNGKIDEEICVD